MSERIEFFQHALGDAELASVRRTLESLFLTCGPRVAEFEAAFGALLGVEHVVGVSSCSMGLVLALQALGVGPGDEVITTPMTFVATANAVLHLGATPVFADVEPDTGLLDPAAVAAAIGPRTRAILPVHLYGQLADMRAFRALADRHGLALVEDAAHAVEATRDGVRVGQLGDAVVFSFYATKTITSGDGGAVAVHDAAVARRLRGLRNHGMSADAASRHGRSYAHWDVSELGWKAALTDVEAALLLPQLPHLDARRDQRQALVERYEAQLARVPDVRVMRRHGTSGHHLFTVLVPPDRRDAVLTGLAARNIGCGVHYRAVHTLTYYRERLGLPAAALPHAAAIGDATISLPLWSALGDDRVDRVVAALRDSLAKARSAA